MKLNGMVDAFKEQLLQPDLNELSFEERFGLLVDRQWTWQEDRRMNRLISNGKLKINGRIEDIDFRTLSSTIVATQLPIESWHDNIRDTTIADAILDRLIHNSYTIDLKGESMRKLRAKVKNTPEQENDTETPD